jgi:hypothetical protein
LPPSRSACTARRRRHETPAAEVTVEEVDRLLADFAQQDWASESGAEGLRQARAAAVRLRPAAASRQPARGLLPPELSGFLAAERLQRLDKAPAALEAILGTHAGTPPGAPCVFCSAPSPNGSRPSGPSPPGAACCRPSNPRPSTPTPRRRWLADCLEVAHAKGWLIDDFKSPCAPPASTP